MIQTVLNYHLPDYWKRVTYDGRYELFDLSPGDVDYYSATSQFGGMNISKVQRLQNPYVYGRFKLGKEKINITHPSYSERKMYHPIAQIDIKQVAEYNCDYRRYQVQHSTQRSGKNPLFYSTPQEAKQHFTGSNVCIVVVNVMTSLHSTQAANDRDSEYYPEYFVLLD